MPPAFDPTQHPVLLGVGEQLRALAGDAAYVAGRDYLRKGLVKQGVVAGTTAYATVTGSTDYRVSVAFAEDAKVTCTCPAHRRSKYCKHVVAVCAALLERPGDFVITEAAPAPPPAPRRRKATSDAPRAASRRSPAAARLAGLETLDRLLEELADGGVMTLGSDKAALLESAGELVRAQKLRRLGNLTLALQRAAGNQRGATLEPTQFASTLVDLFLARRATGAQLEERIALDPQLAEDLLGKTWREEELEAVAGLELLEVGYDRTSDGEFRVETSYLADLTSGTVYAEKQIVPIHLRSAPKPRHRHRLLVDEAGLYPGGAPRRIRLRRVRNATLAAGDVRRLLSRSIDTVATVRQRLIERLRVPFGVVEIPVLFRPAALVTDGQRIGALDGSGSFVSLEWPRDWTGALPGLLPPAGDYALFGLTELRREVLCLRCLSVIGPLAWGRGPIFPDP